MENDMTLTIIWQKEQTNALLQQSLYIVNSVSFVVPKKTELFERTKTKKKL